MKFKVFISSVQTEFASERKALADYIRSDALLGDFFDAFLFEEQPAKSRSAQAVYLDEVASCDVYLGLFGSRYGSRDRDGVSPTEREYDRATELHKTRLAFVKNVLRRDKKEEAIVNAVCHRDYTSNACVQVMLFRDRLEIINPGSLPKGMTVEDLYGTHDSIPRNSLIARAMSWTSYVEKSGSGTGEILDKCVEYGLARPEFDPTPGFFKTVIWRASSGARVSGPGQGLVKGARCAGPRKRAQEAGPRSGPKKRAQEAGPSAVVHRVILALMESDRSGTEVARAIGQKSLSGRLKIRIKSLLEDRIIERIFPDNLHNRYQKYRLTSKGRTLAAKLAKMNCQRPEPK